MDNKLKTYKVSYILGAINPEERFIEIKTIKPLTEEFIREEIIRKYPKQERFLGDILSTILISEEELFKGEENNLKSNSLNKNNNHQVFNW